MEDYLTKNEIPFDEVLNINKPIGIFIDDNAIGFRGDWNDVLEEIGTMQEWVKLDE